MYKTMNMRALDRTIDGMGAEGAALFRTVYRLLDQTEQEVRAECEAVEGAKYENGFKDGYDRGYVAARDVIFSAEQPGPSAFLPGPYDPEYKAQVMLGAGSEVSDAELERAVIALGDDGYTQGN